MMISIKGTLKTHWIKIKLVRIKMIDKLLPWFPSIDIAMYFFIVYTQQNFQRFIILL